MTFSDPNKRLISKLSKCFPADLKSFVYLQKRAVQYSKILLFLTFKQVVSPSFGLK